MKASEALNLTKPLQKEEVLKEIKELAQRGHTMCIFESPSYDMGLISSLGVLGYKMETGKNPFGMEYLTVSWK